MCIKDKIHDTIKGIQFFYFAKMRFTKDYRKNLRLMKSSHVKTKEKIQEEKSLVEKYWKCKPLHYVRYGLYDLNLSADQLLDYIPPYYLYVHYNKKIFNEVDKLYFSNKLNLYNEFVKRDVNTVPVIAIYQNKKFYQPNSTEEISINQIIDKLDKGDKLFFKPIGGQGGTGIVVLKKFGLSLFNGQIEISDISSVLRNDTCYILQKGIVQRHDFMMINSSSVNTLRIVTQWRSQMPEVKVCVMRIGRNGKDVDNSHQGGLSVQINVDNGDFYPVATAEHGGGIITEHPDSHFVFEGKRIAGWMEIKKTLEEYAAKFPEIKEIAWDVAVTDQGIVIIELNVGYGIDHLQCCCGGLRRVLNIYPQ